MVKPSVTSSSARWEAIPGRSQNAEIDFSADIPKRQAVVEAFKVRVLAPHTEKQHADICPHSLIIVIVGVARIWWASSLKFSKSS